jgi:transposase
MNSIDSDEIIEARIQGESIRSISKRLGCSIEDINDTLDRFAKVTISMDSGRQAPRGSRA